MVLSVIYYMHNLGSVMNKIAIKLGQSRFAALLIAVDAACWGALLFFSIHFFTCPVS